MDRSEIKDRVYKVIIQILKIDAEQIQEENIFTADLGAESIQSVELMA
ncbi:MAG TPA: acyl carrier protein, partial [Candidatus Latescibacteria bacterium]|nr:acyl carrier protein [Candidatus Latescibacterota bacterium]